MMRLTLIGLLASVTLPLAMAQNQSVGISCDHGSKEYIRRQTPFLVKCKLVNKSGKTLILNNVDAGSNCELKKDRESDAPIASGSGPRTVTLQCKLSEPGYFNRSFAFNFQDIKGRPTRAVAPTVSGVVSREACEEVRLDGEGGTFAGIGALEQGMDNCQTHAALNIYDAWRFSHGASDRRQSSPGRTFLEACSVNHIFQGDDYIPGRVLNFLKSRTPCALNATTLNSKTVKGVAVGIEDIEKFAEEIRTEADFDLSPEITKKKIQACAVRSRLPLDMKEVSFLVGAVEDLNELRDITAYVKINCPDKDRVSPAPPFVARGADVVNPLPLLKVSSVPDEWQINQYREIHRCLDQKKEKCQPISISFCSLVLQPKYEAGKTTGPCLGHSVALIGRRFNKVKNRCEFLVRNSSFDPAKSNPSWEPEKGGNIWVDETALAASTFNIVQLEEPKK